MAVNKLSRTALEKGAQQRGNDKLNIIKPKKESLSSDIFKPKAYGSRTPRAGMIPPPHRGLHVNNIPSRTHGSSSVQNSGSLTNKPAAFGTPLSEIIPHQALHVNNQPSRDKATSKGPDNMRLMAENDPMVLHQSSHLRNKLAQRKESKHKDKSKELDTIGVLAVGGIFPHQASHVSNKSSSDNAMSKGTDSVGPLPFGGIIPHQASHVSNKSSNDSVNSKEPAHIDWLPINDGMIPHQASHLNNKSSRDNSNSKGPELELLQLGGMFPHQASHVSNKSSRDTANKKGPDSVDVLQSGFEIPHQASHVSNKQSRTNIDSKVSGDLFKPSSSGTPRSGLLSSESSIDIRLPLDITAMFGHQASHVSNKTSGANVNSKESEISGSKPAPQRTPRRSIIAHQASHVSNKPSRANANTK